MRHTFCFFLSLCVGSLSAVLAAEPPAMTSAPAQSSPPSPSPVTPPNSAEPVAAVTPAIPSAPVDPVVPAATVVPATAVAPAVSVAASPSAKDAEEKVIKRLRGQGYRPKVQNGQTVFCKKEAKMNSRFEVEYCATAEALDIASRNAKDAMADMQRKGSKTPQSN